MKWLKFFSCLAAAVVVFAVATSVTIKFLLRDESTVACPDVTGLDAEEARILALQKGLSLLITKYEKKKDVPYNLILAQVPDAAMPVRLGRTISVIVSDGPQAVEIASYLGLPLEEAQAALREKGVPVKRIVYVPSEVVGTVLAQVPGAGRNILTEEGMSLIVGGREKRFFVMPDIGSEDQAAAMEEMDRKRIKYSVSPPGGSFGWTGKNAPASIPPKTVFSDDQVVEIRTSVGG
jgi:beta-lactam-binding protein with PASTA domain